MQKLRVLPNIHQNNSLCAGKNKSKKVHFKIINQQKNDSAQIMGRKFVVAIQSTSINVTDVFDALGATSVHRNT